MSSVASVRQDRFARVFVDGPEQMPPSAEGYFHEDRGYFFKLDLNDVSAQEATPTIQKASEKFKVEVVKRVVKGTVYKERVYVEDTSEIPEGFKPQEGPQGGLYYETGVRDVATPDSGSPGQETRPVAVVEWDDVEIGDEIVYETPEGEEVFAEVIEMQPRENASDIIQVKVGGEVHQAEPGTYSVADLEKSDRTTFRAVQKAWVEWTGPQGGQGWRNTETSEVRYQEEKPEPVEGEGSETLPDESVPSEIDFDPAEPPEGGYAPGWTGPDEDRFDPQEGQYVEFYEEGSYYYGEIETVTEDGVEVDLSGVDATAEADVDQVTAWEDAEQRWPSYPEPDPEEDIDEFMENEEAEDFIETVNTEPDEGFTFGRNLDVDDPFNRDVWFVGITSENMDRGEMDKQDIVDFYEEWQDVLEDESALHIGGYSFPEEDKVSIDLSVALEDAEEAERFGKKFNQDSVSNLYLAQRLGWDAGGIDTGGDGNSPVETEEDVREALEEMETLAKTLHKGKTKVFDPLKIYEVNGERLSGRQIAYRTMKNGMKPWEEDLIDTGETIEDPHKDTEEKSDEDTEKAWVRDPSENASQMRWRNTRTGEYHYGPHPPGIDAETSDPSQAQSWGQAQTAREWDEITDELEEQEGEAVQAADMSSAVYSEQDDEEYHHEDAGDGSLSKDEDVWTYYYGPKGGEGWINMATGEIRYQKRRPGKAPEGGDGYDDFTAEGWIEPPDDPTDLYPEQILEVETDDGEFVEAEVTHVDEEQGVANIELETGEEWMMSEGTMDQIAAAEDFFDYTPFFEGIVEDSPGFDDVDEAREWYYEEAIKDEIPEDADPVWQQFEVGEDIAVDLEGKQFEVPIVGWNPGMSAEEDPRGKGREPAIALGYEDLGEEVGWDTWIDRFGKPSDASPFITSTESHLETFHPDAKPPEAFEEEEAEEDEFDWEEELEDLEGEEGSSTPSDEEVEPAVAEPSSEQSEQEEEESQEQTGYDSFAEEFDPSDVEEWGSLSDFGFPGGVSEHAMQVGALPSYDGESNDGLVFRTHFGDGHDEEETELGLRQMAAHEVSQALGANVPEHTGHPEEDGWTAAEGVEGQMASSAEPGLVEPDHFIDEAAKQVIVGNMDAHSQNVYVDPEGNVHMVDIDHSAGDITSDFTGQKGWYDDMLDRILGELEDTAGSLGVQEPDIRDKIMERAAEIAQQHYDPEADIGGYEAEMISALSTVDDEYGEKFAENISDNIKNLAEGNI